VAEVDGCYSWFLAFEDNLMVTCSFWHFTKFSTWSGFQSLNKSIGVMKTHKFCMQSSRMHDNSSDIIFFPIHYSLSVLSFLKRFDFYLLCMKPWTVPDCIHLIAFRSLNWWEQPHQQHIPCVFLLVLFHYGLCTFAACSFQLFVYALEWYTKNW